MASETQNRGGIEGGANRFIRKITPGREKAGNKIVHPISGDIINATLKPTENDSVNSQTSIPEKADAFRDILLRRKEEAKAQGIIGPDKNDLAYVRSDKKPGAWYRFWQGIAKRYDGLSTTQKIITVVGGIGTAVGMGYAGIHRFITGSPSEQSPINFDNIIPYEFDATAIKSDIGRNNLVKMAVEEYKKIAPPLWEEQSRTLTIPLPIYFRDNRIPTLRIEKSSNFNSPKLIVTTIDGLEQGDAPFSPVDGTMTIYPGGDSLRAVFLDGIDNKGNKMSVIFATTGLEPSVEFDSPTENKVVIPIKFAEPIGNLLTSDRHSMFKGQIQITGIDLGIENFNLGTDSEKKVIILQKEK
jgi:hypothetical protein